MSIFERTKETATEKGLSLRELEQKAGLGEKSIYSWKKYTPRGTNIQKVADVLGVSVDYLLGNTDEKRPSGNKSSGDLKEFFEENPALSFDGKEIPQEDLKIIKRILESMDDDD